MQLDNEKSQSQLEVKKVAETLPIQIITQKTSSITFTTQGLPNIISKKVAGIVEQLNSEVINVQSLKAFLAEGIPDEAAIIREYCWKVILGYLPPEKEKWQITIKHEKQTYEGLVKMFLPEEKFEDYPLLLRRNHPRYNQLENDYLLWEQIEKDTSRTHAEFSFFASQSEQIMIPYFTSARREKFKLINGEREQDYQQFLKDKQKQRKTYRYDYMTRILYIYSKLNPRIQYVQGMNEILAPIFYLVNVSKPANAIEQSSCFFMFNNAICDIIELHIKDLDKSHNGIYGKLNQVNQMLMVIDSQIWTRMQQLKIDPFYYCFRWVTLLYAQDFALFDTMRIWQSIFSSQDRCLYINFFAISIIVSSRDIILQNQFTVILQYLQNIKDNLNINSAIKIANELLKLYKNTDFKKESEVIKKEFDKQCEKEAVKEQEKNQKDKERKMKEKEKKKKLKEKEDRIKEKEAKKRTPQKQEQLQDQKQLRSSGEEKAEQSKSQKKGFFKKFSNLMDKFLN